MLSGEPVFSCALRAKVEIDFIKLFFASLQRVSIEGYVFFLCLDTSNMKPELASCPLSKVRFFSHLCALSAVVSIGSYAQTPPATPNSGSLLQSIPVPRSDSKVEKPLGELLRNSPPISDVDELKLDVVGYRITGLTVAKEAEFLDRLKPFTGTGKNFQALKDAASRVQQALFDKGYFLANVLIPVQSVKDGYVELVVLEGRLGRINVNIAPDADISEQTIRDYLGSLNPGSVLTVGAAERVIFLLGDLRGVQVNYVFSPGVEPGTADITFIVTARSKYGGSVELDMNGSIYTGITRIGGSLERTNLLGNGDSLTLRALTSTEINVNRLSTGGLGFGRVSYVSPVGSSGTKLGAAYTSLRYSLGQEFAILKPKGEATVSSLIALHPFVRSRNLNVIASAQFDYRKFEDRQEAVGQVSRNETKLVALTLGGDARDDIGGGGTSTFSFSGTRGKLSILESQDSIADEFTSKTAGNYHKLNLTLTRLQQFLGNTTLYGSAVMQVAGKNLNTSEKLSLGGPNGVRAYPQGEGVADEGSIVNLELRVPLSLAVLKDIPGRAVFVTFYDYATSKFLKNPYQPTATTPNTTTISGFGFGVNWEIEGAWSLRSSAAWRQTRAATSELEDKRPRFFLQLSRLF